MGTLLEDKTNDLMLLIEISCLKIKKLGLFESFHSLLLEKTFKATDVELDYNRKRIYMNVMLEESKKDYITKFDQVIPYRMASNLYYADLSYFLKSAIKNDGKLLQYFEELKQNFMQCHTLSHENSKALESMG